MRRLLLLICCAAAAALGRDFFVDCRAETSAEASSCEAGAADCPFATIARALSAAAAPNDAVFVRGGGCVYAEDVDLSALSHAGPFALAGVGAAPPVVLGSVRCDGGGCDGAFSNVSVHNVAFFAGGNGSAPLAVRAKAALGGLRFVGVEFRGSSGAVLSAETALTGTGVAFVGCEFVLENDDYDDDENASAPLLSVACGHNSESTAPVSFEGCTLRGGSAVVVECPNASIRIQQTRTVDGTGVAVHGASSCDVSSCEFSGNGLLLENVASATISHCDFRGISVLGPLSNEEEEVHVLSIKSCGSASVANCSFREIGGTALAASAAVLVSNGTGSVTLRQNDFSGTPSAEFAVRNAAPTAISVNAAGNFWGDETGPEHRFNPTGNGPHVTDGVDFWGWCATIRCSQIIQGVNVCAEAEKRPEMWVVLVAVFGSLVGLSVLAALLWLGSRCAHVKPTPFSRVSVPMEDTEGYSDEEQEGPPLIDRRVNAAAAAAAATPASPAPQQTDAEPAVAAPARTSEDEPRSLSEAPPAGRRPTQVIELAHLSPSRANLVQASASPFAAVATAAMAPATPRFGGATSSLPQSASSSYSGSGSGTSDSQEPSVHSSQLASDREETTRPQSLEAVVSSRSFSAAEEVSMPLAAAAASAAEQRAAPQHHFRRHAGSSPRTPRTPRTPSAGSSMRSLSSLQEGLAQEAVAFDGSESSEFGDLQ